MKKKTRLCALVSLTAVLALTGCLNNSQSENSTNIESTLNNENELINYTNSLNINSERERIIKSVYSNLSISDSFYIECPEKIDNISFLEITSPYNLTWEEFDIDVFYKKVKDQFQLLFPNTKFDPDYLFCNANVDFEGNYFYPTVVECYDKIKNNKLEFDWFEYNDGKIYILWSRSNGEIFPYRMTKGIANDLSDADGDLNSWLPSNSCQVIEENILSTDSDNVEYELNSGKVNLKEAIDYVENEYIQQFGLNSELGINVPSTDVYKVNEDVYGYHFNARLTYKDIPFDSVKGSFGSSASSDGNEYKLPICHLFMVDEKNVDFLLGFDFSYFYKETGNINKIVSAEQAIKIASDTLTDNVQFDLKSAELVYSQTYKDNDLKSSTYFARPEWKIKAINPNDSYTYAVYVDAETGNSRYKKFSDKQPET